MKISDIDLGALAGDRAHVEAFFKAGHVPVMRKRNDGADVLDSAWSDERDEHVGPLCSVCGYGICVACDSAGDVPACDGPEGKVRRRRKRLDYVAGLLREAETALNDAQRQAGNERVESEADVRARLDGIVFAALKSQVNEVGIAVRSVDGLHTIWFGAEMGSLAESARYVADQVKKYSDA